MIEGGMDIIAVVLAHDELEGLPHGYSTIVGGRPLILHTLRHAAESARIDRIYVVTSDPDVARIAQQSGVETTSSPPGGTNAAAVGVAALLHVLDEHNRRGLPDPALIVCLQCTFPIRRSGDIDAAIGTLESNGADSLFSGTGRTRPRWTETAGACSPAADGAAAPGNRWAMPRQYDENGSIYVSRPDIVRRENKRLGGRVAVYRTESWCGLQLDSTNNLDLIDWVLRQPEFSAPIEWPDPIELVVFDFDGVFTDNKVVTDSDGREYIRADRGDGMGIARLRDTGLQMMVLSTEENPVTAARCRKLGIECVQGVADKTERLKRLLAERQVSAAGTIYLGNDVNDAGCFRLVGLAVRVADAHPDVWPLAKLALTRRGGDGAVRELCDLIITRTDGPRRTDAHRYLPNL